MSAWSGAENHTSSLLACRWAVKGDNISELLLITGEERRELDARAAGTPESREKQSTRKIEFLGRFVRVQPRGASVGRVRAARVARATGLVGRPAGWAPPGD